VYGTDDVAKKSDFMTRQLSMSVETSLFAPGTLWHRLLATTTDALQSGALEPIETRGSQCEDRGIRFLIRMVVNLRNKPQGDENRNPFLPYERGLYVADASDTHVCLLNKFNVVEHHLLIITRAFEHQEEMLTTADFQALWRCLLEYESLGFYNSGSGAGASQPHKHLQLVPLPLRPSHTFQDCRFATCWRGSTRRSRRMWSSGPRRLWSCTDRC
jgi:ATP adenylyltransferase